MSIAKADFWSIVMKQLRYKLKAYRGVYTSMITVQVLALLFSFGSTSSMSGSSSIGLSYNVFGYSGSLILIFTMLWGLMSAILITTKAYRYDDFVMVSTRMTSQISSLLFLVISSIIGGLTAIGADYLLRDLLLLFKDTALIFEGSTPTFQGVIGSCVYLLLFSLIGYTCGILVQLKKIFLFIIPLVVIGIPITMSFIMGIRFFTEDTLQFFLTETSFLIFIWKFLVVSISLLLITFTAGNRLAVRP